MKKILLTFFALSFVSGIYAQIPMLNSKPTIIHKVIYLDFDGQVVIGTAWNSSTSNPTITALPSTLSSANMTNIWRRMSEDFMPFDVNVTTDVAKFNAATPTSRMRIVITPSSSWYPSSVGGVAYLNSFTWGGNPDTPCWVFENALGYSAKNCAEAGSHEGGHTLSLKHQSIWNASCAKTAEYHNGIGSGVTGWAPIMGVGYSKNVTIWHNGTNSNTCTTIQFDHGSNGITGAAFLSYTLDDVGNTYASGKTINTNTVLLVDSGMITTPTDIDVFKFSICNNRYMTFNVKPWALDTVNYDAANLDIRFKLFNATTSASLAIDTPLAKLNTLVGINLPAGNYYFEIDGGGSANYSDYGSLGRYYMRITSNNIPSIISAFNTPTTICTNQNFNFVDASTGGPPTVWSWTMTGATPASASASNASGTYATPGIYSVSLLASGGTLTSCGVTKTIQVTATPTINTIGSAVCANFSSTLSASGASSYTWNPGALNGASIVVNPTSTAVYTVMGTSSGCNSSSTAVAQVYPIPAIFASSSSSLICDGETATLTASGGATTYTWSTNAPVQSIIVTPTVTTTYTVTGTDAFGCVNSTTVNLIIQWCTGINELDPNNSDFSIYPNPTSGVFFLKTNLNHEHEVMVLNTLGQVILKSKLNSGTKVDLTKEANGIYQVIILDNGKAVYSTKVIKN